MQITTWDFHESTVKAVILGILLKLKINFSFIIKKFVPLSYFFISHYIPTECASSCMNYSTSYES